MAHEIRARLDPANAPSDKQTRFENWTADFTTVGDSPTYRENAARKDRTMPAYDEFEARFSIQEDRQTIIDALTSDYFPNVSWLVVHDRHADIETDTLREDPDYFDPTMDAGLRAPATFDREGWFTLAYPDLHYRHNASNYTATADTITLDQPDSATSVTLYADTDGTVGTTGDVEVATVEVHPGKIVAVEPVEFSLPVTEFGTQAVERGTPPTYFADVTEGFPDYAERQPIDRAYVSEDTAHAIRDARGAGDIQAQLDHIEDVLDVIDL